MQRSLQELCGSGGLWALWSKGLLLANIALGALLDLFSVLLKLSEVTSVSFQPESWWQVDARHALGQPRLWATLHCPPPLCSLPQTYFCAIFYTGRLVCWHR